MLKIATRDSNLALKQTNEVLKQLPQGQYEIIKVRSFGDAHKEISLLENNIDDIFTRELDELLLAGKADIAIHSAKDLPIPLPEGLEVYALTKALDKADALVSHNNLKLKELPKGAKVGTSSKLRQEQLLKERPDLKIISIRGTIAERIKLVEKREIDAVVIAACALKRLGLNKKITEVLSFKTHSLQGNLAVVGQSDRKELIELFSSLDIRRAFGKVYLVGGGPGDPELLTFKAIKALRAADLIIFDDLTAKASLNNLPTEQVYVGKRKGEHSKEQDEINEQIYENVLAGKNVCRLKGGDPFIFGRGGEEVDYLEKRLIAVEVIPGITVAMAAAAAAGIPLTQRDIASSVAFATGHPVEAFQVPNADTIVIYMGASTLREIIKKIIANGRSENTPIALISSATLPSQSIEISTLAEVLKNNKEYSSPLLVIIGEVVKRRNTQKQIKNKILVTGTDAAIYKKYGEVVHQPLIEIKPIADYKEVDAEIKNLAEYSWLVFTSKYAVQYFFERLNTMGLDARALGNIKIAVVGVATKVKLAEKSIMADLIPELESSKGLIELFEKQNIKEKNILIPRSELGLDILPKGLAALGNKVKTLSIYQNVLPKNINKLDLSQFNAIVFTSPSTVINFRKIYKDIPKGVELIARGEETAKVFRDEKI